MILASGVWISGHTLADTADELLGFFGKYDTSQEGTDTRNNVDPGDSLARDLFYHVVTIDSAFFMFSSIMFLAYIFAFTLFNFGQEPEYCDVEDVNEGIYGNIAQEMEDMHNQTLDYCLTTVTEWFKTIDLDSNGVVDRCEDAKFLRYLGNTQEYSLQYSDITGLTAAKDMCYHVIPDAYNQMEHKDFME